MNDRFPVLTGLARVLSFLGALCLMVSIISLFLIPAESPKTAGLGFMGWIICLPMGILFLVMGELLGVAFSIEQNTWKTAQKMAELAKQGCHFEKRSDEKSLPRVIEKMIPKCNKCGEPLSGGSKFCENCGTSA